LCEGWTGQGFGNAAPGMVGNGFTLGSMSMVMTITIPDETARRIEAVAAARGDTIEHVAVEALDTSPLLIEPVDSGEVDLLEAFIGCGTSDGTRPTEIHEMRRELAARKWAAGIENL
jgi:hypothetical protein